MNDAVALAIMVFGAPLGALAFVTWLLQYFVALKSPPTQRAAWTVGPAYMVAATLCAFGAPEGYWWAAPFASIPAALVVFWWWRRAFRRAWLNSADDLPQGTVLANDDWRAGLIFIGGTIAFLALGMLIRRVERGQL
jgi:hypothetical protein